MERRFNFGSNKKHEKAVDFVKARLEPKYIANKKVGDLPCDLILESPGNKEMICYVSVIKMTKSSKYGATTLEEWLFAYNHIRNFYFAVVIGDCESDSTDVYYYKPNEMMEMSYLPPFYYKCSVTKEYIDKKYCDRKLKCRTKVSNENGNKLTAHKSRPTKKNTYKALMFFNNLA